MPLLATSLKSALEAATEAVDNVDDALTSLGDAIADYVKDNAVVNYGWVAVNPAGAPDPVVAATGEITVFEVSLSVIKSASGAPAPAGIILMQTALITSMTAGLHNITQSGFVTVPSPMASSPSLALLSFAGVQGKDNRSDAYTELSNAIVTWVKAQVPTMPVAGTHGVFVGTGTLVSIL